MVPNLNLFKSFKLTPKNKQKIIKEAQKDYSTWSSIEKLARKLEFKNSMVDKQ